MTADDIAKFFPQLDAEKRQVAADLHTQADSVREFVEQHVQQADMKRTLLHNWSSFLLSTIQAL